MGLFNLTLGAASTGDSGSPDPNNTPPTEPKPPCDFDAEVKRNYYEMVGYWVENQSEDATGWNNANKGFWEGVNSAGGDCSKVPKIDAEGNIPKEGSGSGSGSGGGGSDSGGGGDGGGGSGEEPKETKEEPKEGGGGGGGGDDQGKNNACLQQIDMLKAKFQADFAALTAEAKTIAAPFTQKFSVAQVYDPKDPCKGKDEMQKVYDGMNAAVAALPPKGVDVPATPTPTPTPTPKEPQTTPPTGVDSPTPTAPTAPAPTPTAPTPTAPAPTPTAPTPTAPTPTAPTPTAPLKPASSIDPASKPVGTVDPVFDAAGNKIGQCTYGVDPATGNRTAQVETTNPTTGAKTSVLLTKNQTTGAITGSAAQGNGQTTTTATATKVDGKKVAIGIGVTALAIAAFNSAGASGGRKK